MPPPPPFHTPELLRPSPFFTLPSAPFFLSEPPATFVHPQSFLDVPFLNDDRLAPLLPATQQTTDLKPVMTQPQIIPSNIPLKCTICPKKPTFSDTSHLLTHVASKGHLSHYFKVKVRADSGTDDVALETLHEYDRWYAHNGIGNLMQERMNLKDTKKRTRNRQSSNKVRQTSTRPSQADELRRRATTTGLDPRLSEHFKNEPSSTPPPGFGDNPFHRDNVPSLSAWPSPFTAVTRSVPGLEGSDIFTESTNPFDRKLVTTPPPTTASTADSDDLVDPTIVAEASKLKGIYWPGMDLFDAATPEMKRKRNQRKDVSVVEQLELNSLEVEPNEMVFTPFGSLYKQKPISGSVTDSSPIKLDTSPRVTHLNRAALQDLDTNLSRSRRRRSPQKRRVQSLAGDEDLELQLTLGASHSIASTAGPSRKRKKIFDVYEEEPSKEVSFTRPAAFNLLTAEYHPPLESMPTFDYSKPFNDSFHQPSYEGLGYGLDYHSQTTSYLGNGHTFQPSYFNHAPQADMTGLFNNQFPYGSAPWTNAAFPMPETQLEAHVDEKFEVQQDFDDQRTITAPPSEASQQ